MSDDTPIADSIHLAEDDTQPITQLEVKSQAADAGDATPESMDIDQKPVQKIRKPRTAAPVTRSRVPGESVFPFARVRKILKEDKVRRHANVQAD